MSLIKLDSKIYNVGEVRLQRDAEIIYDPLTQGVMIDFSEMDDAVATKYVYSLTVERRVDSANGIDEYDAFYYDITTPKSVRLIELPFGNGRTAFKAKIKVASDNLYKSYGGTNKWGGLTVTIEPVAPQRYADETARFMYVQTTDDEESQTLYIKQDEGVFWFSIDGANWIQGKMGEKGEIGETGYNGWTAVTAVVSDGERRVLRVVDWTGGTGSKPTAGVYVGSSGFVSNIAQAADIRGATGNNGLTPYIGENGNFWIGSTDTGVLANWQPNISAAITSHNDSAESHPDKVPFVYDSGGVRTLRNVVSKRISGTGIIMITLPEATPDVFLTVEVSGNDASTSTAWDLMIGGVLGSDAWVSKSALLISATKIIDKAKRGTIGGKRCFLLTPAREWNALISIKNVLNDNLSLLSHDGWDISLITDESGLTNIVECAVEFPGILSWSWTPRLDGGIGGSAVVEASGTFQKVGNLNRMHALIVVIDKADILGEVVVRGMPVALPDGLNYIFNTNIIRNEILYYGMANPLLSGQRARCASQPGNPVIFLQTVNLNGAAIGTVRPGDIAYNSAIDLSLEWYDK